MLQDGISAEAAVRHWGPLGQIPSDRQEPEDILSAGTTLPTCIFSNCPLSCCVQKDYGKGGRMEDYAVTAVMLMAAWTRDEAKWG